MAVRISEERSLGNQFVGMILFAAALAALQLGNQSLEIVVIIGAVMSLISMLIFAWIVWQAAMRSA